MKKILAVMLAGVLVIGSTANILYAAPKENKGKPDFANKQEKKNDVSESDDETFSFEEAAKEELKYMVEIGEEAWMKLPPGLSKRDDLPPGLAKLYEEGKFPYGLAKRLGEDEKPPVSEEEALEMLKKLIDQAHENYDAAEPSAYAGEALKNFKVLLAEVEAFYDNYAKEGVEVVEAMTLKLKTAILTLENQLIYGEDKLLLVKALYNELLAYGALYFEPPYDQYADYPKYKALIDEMKPFIDGTSTVPLTKERYDAFFTKAEDFKDAREQLNATIEAAKTVLYVKVSDTQVAYRYVEGTDAGEILAGSNQKLSDAIIAAKAVLVNSEKDDYVVILATQEALEKAVMTFKNAVILGEPAVNTLKGIEVLLKAHAETSPSTELNNLILDYAKYTVNGDILTTGAFNTLLDASKVYVDALYDGIEASIRTLIYEGNALLVSTHNAGDAEVLALTAAVSSATLYLNSDSDTWTFEALKGHHDSLKAAIEAFKTSDAETA